MEKLEAFNALQRLRGLERQTARTQYGKRSQNAGAPQNSSHRWVGLI
jgi:hypothetical protein